MNPLSSIPPLSRLLSVFLLAAFTVSAADWPEWRGPYRDGRSMEKGLPSSWSPSGENLVWKAPYGSRSTPVVFNDRLYLLNTAGANETLQERLVALDAKTGKLLWEYKYNVYLSDVPPHRAAWSSPAVDPETGNVYIFGVGGFLASFSPEGRKLWSHSMNEEFGLITTHGGRTVSPLIHEDLLIVSGLNSNWGDQARGLHRFFGLDKKTGEIRWISGPGGSPFDTTWAAPVIALIEGQQLFISGGGDGAVHALQPRTGVPVWSFPMSKRGVNTGIVVDGKWVIVSHSEENLNTSTMGLIASVDGTSKGEIKEPRWAVPGWLGGAASPIIDGDRIYQIDLSANLTAFDTQTGRRLWTQNLGTIQKGSPVLADGKLYVGTEGGEFFILKPHQDRCEVLDKELFGDPASPDAINGSPAISNGIVFFSTGTETYAFGKYNKTATQWPNLDDGKPAPGAKAAHVQVIPGDLVLSPKEAADLTVRLFDEKGRFLRKADSPQFTLAGLPGSVQQAKYAPPADAGFAGGMIKASVDGAEGATRVRVIPPLPWDIDFEKMPGERPPASWINATGKFTIQDVEGNKVLTKLSNNPFLKRARVFLGEPDWKNYTVQVDFRAAQKRRQMGDAGVIAQRYQLTLFGNKQELAIMPWQPETHRTASQKFKWQPDTWYRMKLKVDNTGGKTVARGKVWPAAETEPSDWTIELTDTNPNTEGSPGIYADAPFDIHFDNLKVIPN